MLEDQANSWEGFAYRSKFHQEGREEGTGQKLVWGMITPTHMRHRHIITRCWYHLSILVQTAIYVFVIHRQGVTANAEDSFMSSHVFGSFRYLQGFCFKIKKMHPWHIFAILHLQSLVIFRYAAILQAWPYCLGVTSALIIVKGSWIQKLVAGQHRTETSRMILASFGASYLTDFKILMTSVHSKLSTEASAQISNTK